MLSSNNREGGTSSIKVRWVSFLKDIIYRRWEWEEVLKCLEVLSSNSKETLTCSLLHQCNLNLHLLMFLNPETPQLDTLPIIHMFNKEPTDLLLRQAQFLRRKVSYNKDNDE